MEYPREMTRKAIPAVVFLLKDIDPQAITIIDLVGTVHFTDF